MRRACQSDLTAWALEALRPYNERPARHHLFLIRELEAVARGETDRLMVFMPPGSAKTRYGSLVFPPWMLAQQPGLDVIGASYNSEFAEDISLQLMRIIRDNEDVLGYSFASGSRKLWYTTNRGRYRAAGAGGGITGRRADLFVIDDPLKGRQEADSLVIRDGIWAWYRAEVVTRLKPGGRIVLIQTRWHHDDLAARLLNSDHAADWRVVELPAIAEANDQLGREVGEPLWPEWESGDALKRRRDEVGPREWSALYQQHPTPLEGAFFKPSMMRALDAEPANAAAVVRSWDLASVAVGRGHDPDWTRGLKLARLRDNTYAIVDLVSLRGGPDEVMRTIEAVASQDGRGVRIRIPQDPGQAGVQQVAYITRNLAGYNVTADRETGDKATRADPVASQVNVGNVGYVRAAWNREMLEELAAFPAGVHDDIVDALSGAFAIVGLGQLPIRISAEALRLSRERGPGALSPMPRF